MTEARRPQRPKQGPICRQCRRGSYKKRCESCRIMMDRTCVSRSMRDSNPKASDVRIESLTIPWDLKKREEQAWRESFCSRHQRALHGGARSSYTSRISICVRRPASRQTSEPDMLRKRPSSKFQTSEGAVPSLRVLEQKFDSCSHPKHFISPSHLQTA